MTTLVLAMMGRDRPGIVEILAGTIASHGGNWLESHLTHLSGQFAGIVRIEVAADRLADLENSLRALSGQGINVLVAVDHQLDDVGSYLPVHLDLVGSDRPGIVREVSQVLAARQVNVEDIQTDSSGAPMSGDRIFRAIARLRLPSNCSIDDLRDDLEQIAHDLMVEITVAENPDEAAS